MLIFALCVSVALPGHAQTAQYKLQPTDTLTITVHGHPDLTTKTRVTSEGYVSFPLVGKVRAQGLTVQAFEERLKTLLEKDYLVSAPVIVFIETYHPRQVSVLGQVTTPGKFDMPEERDLTLLDAIAMAEGFTKDALITQVRVIRKKDDGTEELMIINVKEITAKSRKAKKSRRSKADETEGGEAVSKDDNDNKNIILEPNDIVYVPESFF